jgi:alpha-1,3-rhamnosyl/mannosyltransferase
MFEVGRRADLIITVSESTRNDVLRELRIAPEWQGRVVSIPEAADAAFRPADTPRKNGRLRILFVGRRDPYKNLTGLVEAFAQVRARGIDAVLRVIGPEDARYPEAPRRALELGVNDHIEWAGYVADRKLAEQYQQSDVFVLASKYEGFGLTVLEAMACGTPVVCSNISSLPEVAGDAALLVDPQNPGDIAGAIARMLTEPQLAASLREKGLARAAQFSWKRTAELTLKAYESLA